MSFTKKIDVAAIVAGAAFLASAGHIVSVVRETDHLIFALAYPIGIDGLIYVGIKAMTDRRFGSGLLALVIGTFFSLAFNFDATGAVDVHPLVIAASMPVCLLAAVVIEHFGKKAEEPAPAAAPIAVPAAPIPAPLPAPKPIAWVAAGARWTLPIVPLAAPAPIKVRATVNRVRPVSAPPARPAIEDGSTTGGRAAKWDVETAVRLLGTDASNASIASEVGTNEKAIQRTRRAFVLIAGDASLTDADVADMMNKAVSPAHVGRVRAAMKVEA